MNKKTDRPHSPGLSEKICVLYFVCSFRRTLSLNLENTILTSTDSS